MLKENKWNECLVEWRWLWVRLRKKYDLQKFIDKVKLCIQNHRASVIKDKFSIEEICVADADAMSHLDSVVELICWRAYLGEDIVTCNNFVKKKIQKSYAKMSNETKELMQYLAL